jgi:hypothetical protein
MITVQILNFPMFPNPTNEQALLLVISSWPCDKAEPREFNNKEHQNKRPSLLTITCLIAAVFPVTFALAQVNYNPYTFTTLAGAASIGSADGTNSAARFYEPTKVVVDNSGNLYVSDNKNFTIRKITPVGTNWVVSTIVGLAGQDNHIDGTGSAARFEYPDGMVVDGVGNIYVADYNSIRKLTLNGTNWVVTTVANGFYYPYGLALDGTGNIYVGDSWNHTIRKITQNGGNWVVTTLAGLAGGDGSANGTNSEARFNYPQGVAVDSAGNVFVADTWNHTIRKITPVGTNWVVTTFAGVAGGDGEADGTGSAARFKYPQDVAVDGADNIYVADGYAVRKITPAGVVTTLAGLTTVSGDSVDGTNSAARFRGPTGLSADSSTNIFVADKGNNSVRKVTPVGNQLGGDHNRRSKPGGDQRWDRERSAISPTLRSNRGQFGQRLCSGLGKLHGAQNHTRWCSQHHRGIAVTLRYRGRNEQRGAVR